MCVLSQDNDGKRVFERLYETGVVQVKKRQEEQEEKRIKENEVKLPCKFLLEMPCIWILFPAGNPGLQLQSRGQVIA